MKNKIILGSILSVVFILLILVILNMVIVSEPKIPTNLVGSHIEIDGIKIRYYQLGKGQDIIFVHGASSCLEDYLPMAQFLSTKYRVTLYDRPGCGFSDVNSNYYSLQGNAVILKDLIDKLGLKNPLIIGHSYGSGVSLAFYDANPNVARGYILMGICAYPYEEIKYAERLFDELVIGNAVVNPIFGNVFAKMIMSLSGKQTYKDIFTKVFLPAKMSEEYIANSFSNWYSDPRIFITLFRNAWGFDKDIRKIYKNYPKMETNLTIIQGEKDFFIETLPSAKRLNTEIEKSKMILLPETGHMVFFQNPNIVIQEISLMD
jgi:pimeloyl-ACP methyl ester carboxylesterase